MSEARRYQMPATVYWDGTIERDATLTPKKGDPAHPRVDMVLASDHDRIVREKDLRIEEMERVNGRLANAAIERPPHKHDLLQRIEELEKRQAWIDQVARPAHPDDERPWASAYLDARQRIEELETALREIVEIERRDNLTDPDQMATDEWRTEAWEIARSALATSREDSDAT